MAVLWTFREFSLCRHVRRELLRKAALNLTLIIPVTVCHQISYVERYSRFMVTAIKAQLWGWKVLNIDNTLGGVWHVFTRSKHSALPWKKRLGPVV